MSRPSWRAAFVGLSVPALALLGTALRSTAPPPSPPTSEPVATPPSTPAARSAPPVVGEMTDDKQFWWDGTTWKSTARAVPKTYLWLIVPLIVLVLSVVITSLVFLGLPGTHIVPEAVYALTSTALGALVGLLIPAPHGNSSPADQK